MGKASKHISPSRKADIAADKARAKAQRAMRDAEFTPAQRIMRDEMSKGVHQAETSAYLADLKPVSELSAVLDHRGVNMQNPTKLGAVLDDVMGPQPAGDPATAAALEVINDYDGQIVMSMKQWSTVQAMMEDAYRRGLRECGHA